MPVNLFANPLFSDIGVNGKIYYNHNGIAEVAAPHGWQVRWIEQAAATSPVPGYSSMPLPSQDSPFARPEFVVWPKSDAPANEQESLFGVFPVLEKIFAGWKPIWFEFFQNTDLVAGERYRFSLSVYPDLVAEMSGQQKIYAADPISGEFRALGEAQWHDGGDVITGQWNRMIYEFTAGDSTQVGLEFRGRHGLLNTGVFIRDPKLEWLGDAPPPTPTPTPGGNSQTIEFTFQKTVPVKVRITATVE